LPAATPDFIDELKRFASGATSIADFALVVNRTIGEGPQVLLYDPAEPDVVFSAELEAAFYLDMVVDDGPEHNVDEARHLAGTLAVLLEGCRQSDELLADLLTLARWKRRSAERFRAYASGQHDRAGFERFVERRPWSRDIQLAILHLAPSELESLANYLDANDWSSIHSFLGSRPNEEL
jgi:hypothetical protein